MPDFTDVPGKESYLYLIQTKKFILYLYVYKLAKEYLSYDAFTAWLAEISLSCF